MDPEEPSAADIEATLAAHDAWVAAGAPGAMWHEQVVAEWLATAEIDADPAEADRLRQAIREAEEGKAVPWVPDAASSEELDALEEAGLTADLTEEEVRRIFGLPEGWRDERGVPIDEVRRRLGLAED